MSQNNTKPDLSVKLQMDKVIQQAVGGSSNAVFTATTVGGNENHEISGLKNYGTNKALQKQTRLIERDILGRDKLMSETQIKLNDQYVQQFSELLLNDPKVNIPESTKSLSGDNMNGRISQNSQASQSSKSINSVPTPFGYEKISNSQPVFKPVAAKVYRMRIVYPLEMYFLINSKLENY